MAHDFTFLRPIYLLLLLSLPWIYRAFNRFANKTFDPWRSVFQPVFHQLLVRQSRERIGLMNYRLCGVILLFMLAASGPAIRWSMPVMPDQVAHMIVLDLSSNMRSDDIKPSRWQRAIYKAIDIVDTWQGAPCGLLVFAKRAYNIVPMTLDASAIKHQLGQLHIDIIPEDGYRLDRALELAKTMINRAHFHTGHVLVLTAGTPDQRAITSARDNAKLGIHTSVLAVGTRQASPLRDASGRFLYQASGALKTQQIDDVAIMALAKAGKGSWQFFHTDDRDIRQLDRQLNQWTISNAKHQAMQAWKYRELSPWLVMLALILVMPIFKQGMAR